MAHAALAAGARRLVTTSTWNTYGVGQPEISEESDQRGGASEISYVRTKHLTEEELRAVGRKGLDVVTVDPGHMSGRYHTRNWGRIIRMVGRHACPACRACAAPSAMAPRWRPRTSPPPSAAGPAATTCCRGVEASFAKVISLPAELLGRPIPTRTIPTWLLTLMARAKVLRAAITGQEPGSDARQRRAYGERSAHHLGPGAPRAPLRCGIVGPQFEADHWRNFAGA